MGPLLSALTRPTAHNMQRKRHPSLEARRVARIGQDRYKLQGPSCAVRSMYVKCSSNNTIKPTSTEQMTMPLAEDIRGLTHPGREFVGAMCFMKRRGRLTAAVRSEWTERIFILTESALMWFDASGSLVRSEQPVGVQGGRIQLRHLQTMRQEERELSNHAAPTEEATRPSPPHPNLTIASSARPHSTPHRHPLTTTCTSLDPMPKPPHESPHEPPRHPGTSSRSPASRPTSHW